MTPHEVAWGWVYGLDPSVPERPRGPQPKARAVFERLIRDALAGGVCAVAFSGGRDSSAVLAVAVDIARRERLPFPIAVTFEYPGDEKADERAWQEMVVRHLGVPEWERIDATEGTDLLGPAATAALIAVRQPIFPAAAALWPWRVAQAPADTWLTGEFGDNVMGVQRATPLSHLVRHRGKVGGDYWRAAGTALAPQRAWARYATREETDVPWLAPHLIPVRMAAVRAAALVEPRWWGDNVWHVGRLRSVTMGTTSVQMLAATAGARVVEPFGDPAFRAALANEGGRLGFPSRTASMRALFGDVLPGALVARPTKATFNASLVGPATEQFLSEWTGQGVNAELVDPDRLAENWRSGSPHALSLPLMQQAWLAHSGALDDQPSDEGNAG